MEEVLVKSFPLSPDSTYFKLTARIYRRADSFIMKMFSTHVDMVTGEEKTTLCCAMSSSEIMSFQNYIGMIADYMRFEQPKTGMHRDSLSYCFVLEANM